MPLSGATSSLGSASSAVSESETTAVGEVGASAGIGCWRGFTDVVFAIGAVMGEGSSAAGIGATAVAGVSEGAPPSAARVSNSGHHALSTSSGSFWNRAHSSSTSHSFAPNSTDSLIVSFSDTLLTLTLASPTLYLQAYWLWAWM